MNKQSFIGELKRLLDAQNIGDADEIIAEYEEHFARKTADGYTEAEIAAKLGDPAEIAGEYDL